MVTFLEEMGGVGRGNILEMECFLGFFFSHLAYVVISICFREKKNLIVPVVFYLFTESQVGG